MRVCGPMAPNGSAALTARPGSRMTRTARTQRDREIASRSHVVMARVRCYCSLKRASRSSCARSSVSSGLTCSGVGRLRVSHEVVADPFQHYPTRNEGLHSHAQVSQFTCAAQSTDTFFANAKLAGDFRDGHHVVWGFLFHGSPPGQLCVLCGPIVSLKVPLPRVRQGHS
jgi:hypothetical protein